MRIGSFAELSVLREALHQARRDAAAREANERAAQALAAAIARSQPAPQGLFARSVGRVYPLPDRQQAQIELPRPLPHPRQRELEADYIGFDIANEFVVGYGLDYMERFRNLPYIGVISEEAIVKYAPKLA